MSTESQEVAIDGKMSFDRYATGAVADDEYNDSIRSQGRVLPSLDGCLFECTTPVDDDVDAKYHRRSSEQGSIDSQMLLQAIVNENDSDDDDSIMSQIKEMSAVEISTSQEEDHPDTAIDVHDNIDEDDDGSLASIVSKAYSMTSSSSTSCSQSACDLDLAEGSNRRVIFVRQQNQVHYIPNRHEYTQEELASVWYRHQDTAVMRKERFEEETLSRQEPEELIAVPEVESFPEELSSSSVAMHLDSPLHEQYLAGAFHRGSCRPSDAQSGARIHAVVDAVMDEQETQWLDEEDDQERLAQASLALSSSCKKDALMRAHLDALEAIPFYLEGGGEEQKDALCNSERSTRSSANSTEKRKDEEIYPLSPMSVSPRARLTKLKLRTRSGKKSSKTVSESRWNPVTSKRALTRKMINKFDEQGSTSLPEEKSDALMPMPKRMASDHGNNTGSEGKRPSLQKLGLSMPQRTVSSSDFSMNSESEFGGDDDFFSEELAPPLTTPEAPLSSSDTTDQKMAQKPTSRTCKFFSKDKSESEDNDGGIYQKMKRKLKGSKKKSKVEKKEKKEKQNKRKKKSKSTKTKKKKAKSVNNKSLSKKDSAESHDDRVLVVDPSKPSGLSDEFEQLDASSN